jgi:hypothetical protein
VSATEPPSGRDGGPEQQARRRALLEGRGVAGDTLAEVLRYTDQAFRLPEALHTLELPLPDEPHLEAWAGYLEDARSVGVFEALARRLVQLRFPVEAGISEREEYRAVTRRGAPPPADRLPLADPEGLELRIHPTPAGRVPVITVRRRGDFELLVQALSSRNEPEPVPPAMGACMVAGLNNWDRIHALRRRWEAAGGDREGSWWDEMARLKEHRELYQDRLILLSVGPYAAVAAAELGLAEEEWLRRSLAIRLDHESTHYLTLRVLGAMRNNLLDELIADYAGLIAGFGEYRASVARRVLGLTDRGEAIEGGRVGQYRGSPPLSEPAFAVVRALTTDATANLEALFRSAPERLREPAALGWTLLALASRTLPELASAELCPRHEEILDR